MSRDRNLFVLRLHYSRDKQNRVQKRILVVEDDADMVELLRFSLKGAGFRVGTATDGIEALKKARSLLPDLVLLDLMLPELDGFAVCEILRRDPATASIPIIIVTALTSQLSRLAGLEAGADAYVIKPFSVKSLIGQVKETVGRHAKQCGESPATRNRETLGSLAGSKDQVFSTSQIWSLSKSWNSMSSCGPLAHQIQCSGPVHASRRPLSQRRPPPWPRTKIESPRPTSAVTSITVGASRSVRASPRLLRSVIADPQPGSLPGNPCRPRAWRSSPSKTVFIATWCKRTPALLRFNGGHVTIR